MSVIGAALQHVLQKCVRWEDMPVNTPAYTWRRKSRPVPEAAQRPTRTCSSMPRMLHTWDDDEAVAQDAEELVARFRDGQPFTPRSLLSIAIAAELRRLDDEDCANHAPRCFEREADGQPQFRASVPHGDGCTGALTQCALTDFAGVLMEAPMSVAISDAHAKLSNPVVWYYIGVSYAARIMLNSGRTVRKGEPVMEWRERDLYAPLAQPMAANASSFAPRKVAWPDLDGDALCFASAQILFFLCSLKHTRVSSVRHVSVVDTRTSSPASDALGVDVKERVYVFQWLIMELGEHGLEELALRLAARCRSELSLPADSAEMTTVMRLQEKLHKRLRKRMDAEGSPVHRARAVVAGVDAPTPSRTRAGGRNDSAVVAARVRQILIIAPSWTDPFSEVSFLATGMPRWIELHDRLVLKAQQALINGLPTAGEVLAISHQATLEAGQKKALFPDAYGIPVCVEDVVMQFFTLQEDIMHRLRHSPEELLQTECNKDVRSASTVDATCVREFAAGVVPYSALPCMTGRPGDLARIAGCSCDDRHAYYYGDPCVITSFPTVRSPGLLSHATASAPNAANLARGFISTEDCGRLGFPVVADACATVVAQMGRCTPRIQWHTDKTSPAPSGNGWRAMHGENKVWKLIFSLLLWDVTYAGPLRSDGVVAGCADDDSSAAIDSEHSTGSRARMAAEAAFVQWMWKHAWQRAPLDFGMQSFHTKRLHIYEARIAYLRTCTPCQLAAEAERSWRAHAGTHTDVRNGGLLHEHRMLDVCELLHAAGAALVCGILDLLMKAFFDSCTGFPDILLWRPVPCLSCSHGCTPPPVGHEVLVDVASFPQDDASHAAATTALASNTIITHVRPQSVATAPGVVTFTRAAREWIQQAHAVSTGVGKRGALNALFALVEVKSKSDKLRAHQLTRFRRLQGRCLTVLAHVHEPEGTDPTFVAQRRKVKLRRKKAALLDAPMAVVPAESRSRKRSRMSISTRWSSAAVSGERRSSSGGPAAGVSVKEEGLSDRHGSSSDDNTD